MARLLVLLVLILAACSGKDSDDSSGTSSISQPTSSSGETDSAQGGTTGSSSVGSDLSSQQDSLAAPTDLQVAWAEKTLYWDRGRSQMSLVATWEDNSNDEAGFLIFARPHNESEAKLLSAVVSSELSKSGSTVGTVISDVRDALFGWMRPRIPGSADSHYWDERVDFCFFVTPVSSFDESPGPSTASNEFCLEMPTRSEVNYQSNPKVEVVSWDEVSRFIARGDGGGYVNVGYYAINVRVTPDRPSNELRVRLLRETNQTVTANDQEIIDLLGTRYLVLDEEWSHAIRFFELCFSCQPLLPDAVEARTEKLDSFEATLYSPGGGRVCVQGESLTLWARGRVLPTPDRPLACVDLPEGMPKSDVERRDHNTFVEERDYVFLQPTVPYEGPIVWSARFPAFGSADEGSKLVGLEVPYQYVEGNLVVHIQTSTGKALSIPQNSVLTASDLTALFGSSEPPLPIEFYAVATFDPPLTGNDVRAISVIVNWLRWEE